MQLRSMVMCLVVSAACASPGPAPPPLRPVPRPAPPRVQLDQRTDCDVAQPEDDLATIKHDERSLEESENLADQGLSLLKASESRSIEVPERERLITTAVRRFLTSLAADPYNVNATYNLAAAYARIKRSQCALNLLDRLRQLRKLRSQQDKVEAKLDRLFGRKQFDGSIDPDFLYLRDDERFREIAKDLQ